MNIWLTHIFICFFPLQYLQITTLINHKDRPKKSERTLAAIHRVGQAVSTAVGRFVAVGEAIASENQELKDEMGQACFEARRAGRKPLAVPCCCLKFEHNVECMLHTMLKIFVLF